MNPENVALFDLDGTLCDHDAKLKEGLEKIRAPNDPPYSLPLNQDSPQYLWERSYIIRETKEWWATLPKFKLGWDILDIANDLEFRIMILTQGPKMNPRAWAGKKEWLDENIDIECDVTMTRDKGLMYGKVLVDDYPPFVERWLEWRKRGLVIMPANNGNKDFEHPQVIRYDGSNIKEVKKAMELAKNRKPSEEVKYK